jgi:hypothetical protein
MQQEQLLQCQTIMLCIPLLLLQGMQDAIFIIYYVAELSQAAQPNCKQLH